MTTYIVTRVEWTEVEAEDDGFAIDKATEHYEDYEWETSTITATEAAS